MGDSKSIFKPTRGLTSEVVGQVMISHVNGRWDKQMHQEATELSNAQSVALDQRGRWGSVVILEDSLVSSLEVLKAGRDTVKDLPPSSNLVALAWVIDPTLDGYSHMLPVYEAMFSGLLTTRVFPDFSDAKDWVEEIIRQR